MQIWFHYNSWQWYVYNFFNMAQLHGYYVMYKKFAHTKVYHGELYQWCDCEINIGGILQTKFLNKFHIRCFNFD